MDAPILMMPSKTCLVKVLRSTLYPISRGKIGPTNTTEMNDSDEELNAQDSESSGIMTTGAKLLTNMFKSKQPRREEKYRETELKEQLDPDNEKYDMVSETFLLSGNTEVKDFKRQLAEYFEIPNAEHRFFLYDERGERIDESFFNSKYVAKILEYQANNDDRDREKIAALRDNGKKYNILYFGDENFEFIFREFI